MKDSIISEYSNFTGEDAPMRNEQRRVLSDYIRLIDDPLDREGLDKQLESGLTCTDAEDMLRSLIGEMRFK